MQVEWGLGKVSPRYGLGGCLGKQGRVAGGGLVIFGLVDQRLVSNNLGGCLVSYSWADKS